MKLFLLNSYDYQGSFALIFPSTVYAAHKPVFQGKENEATAKLAVTCQLCGGNKPKHIVSYFEIFWGSPFYKKNNICIMKCALFKPTKQYEG